MRAPCRPDRYPEGGELTGSPLRTRQESDTAAALLDDAARRLRHAGVDHPRHEAQLLLGRVLGADLADLLAYPDRPIPPDAAARLARLVARRSSREPFAYLVGEREFYGRSFLVDRRVLIPRPETEVLVDEALAVLDARRAAGVGRPLVIDVGTGSGALAATLALEAPQARVVAVDLSAGALAVADANRRRLGLAGRLQLVRGDLAGWLRAPADLIVANLPYLPAHRISGLQPEVAHFEPRLALDGGPDGTALVGRLVGTARDLVRPGGAILLELDPEQVPAIRSLVPWATTRVLPDLAGLDRVLRIDVPPR